MALPALTLVPLSGDPVSAVARVPTGPGVAQLVGPEGRCLLLAPAANLRKWAAAHLGLGPAPSAGRRPKTDLSAVTAAVGWARARGPFEQRLLFERLMAPLVPVAERRDLKPPAFLRLDLSERFPRVTVRDGDDGGGDLYGPFARRRAAEKAKDAVNRRFSLRPCDFVFEPDPALPLGLGCLYAQVRSCAAPCLARVSEDDYRSSAADAAGWLADPGRRPDAPADVPALVTPAATARALVVDPGRGAVGLFPVRGGRVLEGAAVCVAPEVLDEAVRALAWPEPGGASDWPWLATWIASPKGRRAYLHAGDDREALVAAARAALPARLAGKAGGEGGNLGASRGEA